MDVAMVESSAKYVRGGELELQLLRLREVWPALRTRLRAHLIPCAEMKRLLLAVGAPTEPEEIGLTPEHVRRSFFRAQLIRRRFTVLDLMMRSGLASLGSPG